MTDGFVFSGYQFLRKSTPVYPSACLISLHFLLRPTLSLTTLHILHSVPVSVRCYLDDQWWIKKEACLHPAVTQSEASFSADHWRGMLVLQRHDPLPQHFSLCQCVCVFMHCVCEYEGRHARACMCPGKSLNN